MGQVCQPRPLPLSVSLHLPASWGTTSTQMCRTSCPALFPLALFLGALSIVRALDREEVSQHNLTVVATDHGSPRHSATQLLLVQVLDVNDETPTFEKSVYEGQVAENLPAGVPVLQLHATDQDLGRSLLCPGRWERHKDPSQVAEPPSLPSWAFPWPRDPYAPLGKAAGTPAVQGPPSDGQL